MSLMRFELWSQNSLPVPSNNRTMLRGFFLPPALSDATRAEASASSPDNIACPVGGDDDAGSWNGFGLSGLNLSPELKIGILLGCIVVDEDERMKDKWQGQKHAPLLRRGGSVNT